MTKTQAPPSDGSVLKMIEENGVMRASAVSATQVVREMRQILDTAPLATMALGRSMIGCILMASHQKEGHTVGAYFRGNGPLGTIYTEASYEGAVRAYTSYPHADLPLMNGKLDLRLGIGSGVLEVVRGSPFQKQLHTGSVQIVTGEVGDDFAHYLRQSHQIPSVVALALNLDRSGEVVAAGGALIELMPGHTENDISRLEKNLQGAKPLSEMLAQGWTARQFADAYLAGFKMTEMMHDFPLRYECKCSDERVRRSLILLGHSEIDRLIEEGQGVEVRCDFCGRKYTVTLESLQEMRRESYKKSLN
ncbi:MAG: Hsp33 family molecular chaperone HslO [Bdellovibrionales bacterium]|nr:Hsp33 family molecular chaperone HslO [Bdellovibrionales bacterium]